MNLSYSNNLTQLFWGDARKLNQIEDYSVNMIIADPPYGIDYVTGHREKRSPKSVVATLERFDPIIADKNFQWSLMQDALWEMYRVMKCGAVYIFTRWDIYHKLLPLIQEIFTVKNVLTWAKNNWTAGDLVGNYAYQTEIIIFAVKGKPKLLGEKRGTNLLCFKRIDGAKLLHPAQKPVELLSYLITQSCPEYGIVLDPFCGTGSTCVAASNVGRKSIGVDLDRRWLEVAKKRLEHRLLPMFDQTEVAPQNFKLIFEGEN